MTEKAEIKQKLVLVARALRKLGFDPQVDYTFSDMSWEESESEVGIEQQYRLLYDSRRDAFRFSHTEFCPWGDDDDVDGGVPIFEEMKNTLIPADADLRTFFAVIPTAHYYPTR